MRSSLLLSQLEVCLAIALIEAGAIDSDATLVACIVMWAAVLAAENILLALGGTDLSSAHDLLLVGLTRGLFLDLSVDPSSALLLLLPVPRDGFGCGPSECGGLRCRIGGMLAALDERESLIGVENDGDRGGTDPTNTRGRVGPTVDRKQMVRCDQVGPERHRALEGLYALGAVSHVGKQHPFPGPKRGLIGSCRLQHGFDARERIAGVALQPFGILLVATGLVGVVHSLRIAHGLPRSVLLVRLVSRPRHRLDGELCRRGSTGQKRKG